MIKKPNNFLINSFSIYPYHCCYYTSSYFLNFKQINEVRFKTAEIWSISFKSSFTHYVYIWGFLIHVHVILIIIHRKNYEIKGLFMWKEILPEFSIFPLKCYLSEQMPKSHYCTVHVYKYTYQYKCIKRCNQRHFRDF